jgi:amino acid transporter
MILSLTLITLVYTTVVMVMVELIPLEVIGNDLAPVYTVARHIGGVTLGTTFAVIGVLTMASMSNAGLLASSRFPYAMARDRLLPPAFARVHARFRTPVVSILLTTAAMAFVIVALDVERIAKLASGLVILMFVLNNAAVIVFREGRASWYQPAYRSPAYPAMQIHGIAVGLLFLVAMGWVVLAGIAAVAVPGTVLYATYGRRRAARLGVMSKMSARRDLIGSESTASVAHSRGAAVTVAQNLP